MEGSAKIISLIARDENQHLALTQNIINNWRKGDDPDMVQIVKEEQEWTYEMFDKCVNEEKKWAEYLFKDGSMIGLNDKLLYQYVEWIANKRLRAIGLKPVYDQPLKNNPLPWTEHWISSKGLQVAPQETEPIILPSLNKYSAHFFSSFTHLSNISYVHSCSSLTI